MAEPIKISLDNLQVEALADLLNTSKKFGLNEFSDKLTIFAYQNATEFVNHESFVNLQYDVLLDLIKSKWFYAPEIDILRGVLKWHRRKDSRENNQEQTDGIENDLEKLNVNNDKPSVVPTSEEISNDVNTNTNPADKAAEFVASFSGIALKKLLSHIRILQMTAGSFIEETKTELFARYNHMLGGNKYFSQTTEPRQKYGSDGKNKKTTDTVSPKTDSTQSDSNGNKVEALPRLVETFQKVFKVKCPHKVTSWDDTTACASQEGAGFEWKIHTRKLPWGPNTTSTSSPSGSYLLKLYLECTPVDKNWVDWECTTQCQVTFSRVENGTGHVQLSRQILPYRLLTFSTNNNCQHVDDFYRQDKKGYCDIDQCLSGYDCFNEFTITFKVISVKGK